MPEKTPRTSTKQKPAPTSQPAVNKAIEHLASSLDTGIWKPGDRLPPLRELAIAAQVSIVSAWKAVDTLKKAGKVSVVKGGRIYAGKAAPLKSPALEATRAKWQVLRARIEQDMLAGHYVPGSPLPPIGELQARYGICFTTLKKALTSLVTDKRIIPDKREYLVPKIEKRQFQTTIILITEGYSKTHLNIYSPRIQKFIDALENHCQRAGITIEFFGFSLFDPDANRQVREFIRQKTEAVGFILNPWFNPAKEPQQRLVDLIIDLSLQNKPVAIMDEGGEFRMPLQVRKSRFFQAYRIAAKSAGQDVAQLLLNLGHSRVAYFSINHAMLWSKLRLEGLVDQMDKAGLAKKVATFMDDKGSGSWDLVLTAAKYSPEQFAKVFGVATPKDQIEELKQRYEGITNLRLFKGSERPELGRIRQHVQLLGRLLDQKIDPSFYGKLRTFVFEQERPAALYAYLAPVFEKALMDKDITAWVASNDETALTALEFLRVRKIKIPQQISIIGFDNNPEAFENKLTSFDFNLALFAHRMLEFVLRTPAPASNGREPIEVPGIIIERNTTGKTSRKQYPPNTY